MHWLMSTLFIEKQSCFLNGLNMFQPYPSANNLKALRQLKAGDDLSKLTLHCRLSN